MKTLKEMNRVVEGGEYSYLSAKLSNNLGY